MPSFLELSIFHVGFFLLAFRFNRWQLLDVPRTKIETGRKCISRGVSLSPKMEAAAMARATQLDMSFSRYVQRLIEADLRREILKPIDALQGGSNE